jgi:hypothetical protein
MPPVAIFGLSLASGKTGAKSGEGANELTSGSVLAHPPSPTSIVALKKTTPTQPKVFCDLVDLDDRQEFAFMKFSNSID